MGTAVLGRTAVASVDRALSRVRVAMGYYTAFSDEIDRQIDLRRREAAEWRSRYEAERALLG